MGSPKLKKVVEFDGPINKLKIVPTGTGRVRLTGTRVDTGEVIAALACGVNKDHPRKAGQGDVFTFPTVKDAVLEAEFPQDAAKVWAKEDKPDDF